MVWRRHLCSCLVVLAVAMLAPAGGDRAPNKDEHEQVQHACPVADRAWSEEQMRSDETQLDLDLGVAQGNSINVAFGANLPDTMVALRVACGPTTESVRGQLGTLFAIRRSSTKNSSATLTAVAVSSWDEVERAWGGIEVSPSGLAGPVVGGASGQQLVKPLCGDIAPQGGLVSFGILDVRPASWRFALELVPLPSWSQGWERYNRRAVIRAQMIMRQPDGSCQPTTIMSKHQLQPPSPSLLWRPDGQATATGDHGVDELRASQPSALAHMRVAAAITRSACLHLQSGGTAPPADEAGAALARVLLSEPDSTMTDPTTTDPGSGDGAQGESLAAAMRRSGPRLECHGVSAPRLIAELHERRQLYLRMEGSLRRAEGLPPVPQRCLDENHDAVARGGLWAGGGSGPPPLARRPLMGALLQTEECFRVGLEVGSYRGSNADELLTMWPAAWALVLVDPWVGQPNASYADVLAADQTTMDGIRQAAWIATARHGPRAVLWPAFGSDAAAQLSGQPLEFVYLDARHDYTSVTEDLESWWPRLRGGGVMAGHDFLDAGQRFDGNSWEVQPDGSSRADMLAVRGAVEAFMGQRGVDVRVTHQGEAYPSFYAVKPARRA